MNHSLLVVTFYNDLPTFRMFVNLLSKFWCSNKKIKIVYSLKIEDDTLISKEEILPFVQETAELFLKDWDYEIVEGLTTNLPGWEEQQLNKLYFSAYDNKDCTVVFDCKNFILHNLHFENLVLDKKFTVLPLQDKSVSMLVETKKYFEVNDNDFVPSPITPWVWRNDQIFHLYNYLIDKVGLYDSWNIFPGSEFLNHYFFTKNVQKEDSFAPVARRKDNIIYQHRLRNIREVKPISKKLKSIGIEENEVDIWVKNLMPYALRGLL